MTRKRSKYRPKPVNRLSYLVAMQGASVLFPDDVRSLSLPLLAAVDAISRGEATNANWREIFTAVNMTEQWVAMGVVNNERESIDKVQQVMITALDRWRTLDLRALKSDELATLRAFIEDYIALLAGVTHSEYYEAKATVEQRVKRVMAGESVPNARIVETKK